MTTTASDPGGRPFLLWCSAHAAPTAPTSLTGRGHLALPPACSPSWTMAEFDPAPCYLWLESSSGFLTTS